MSLRTRLWLVLGAVFFVPLLIGGLVLAFLVPQVRSDRVEDTLRSGASSVSAQLVNECRLLGATVQMVAYQAGANPDDEDGVAAAVQSAVSQRYAGFATILGPDGQPLASDGELPDGGSSPADLPKCSTEGLSEGVVAEQVPVTGVGGAATAVVAMALDPQGLRTLAGLDGVDGDVLLLDGSTVLASSLDASATGSLVQELGDRSGMVEVDDRLVMVVRPDSEAGVTVVTTAPQPGSGVATTLLFVLILVVAAAAAALLVAVVAKGLSQPFADLTEAAERVARGDLETRLDAPGDGEAGRLSEAFNRMTTELRRNMTALEQSREDLRDSLERIGDTLMSTHDLEGLLQVVLETAVVTLQAEAGIVLYGAPDQLHLVAEHGLHGRGLPAPSVSLGQGVLGRVIASGEGVRGRLGSSSELSPAPTEPAAGDILAVPLRSMGTVLGVLALYDRTDGHAFDATDDDALRTLAGQASIAIDNVQLHQEAQRLSTTDALTGLWNFRYLSMSLAREIERSTRFNRPLAVLMLDLDHFKQVNDVHGHAVGDAVLRELAQRVQEQIREVDTFARYGGEEFVVVLPETTVDGARQLAERICVAVRRAQFHVEGDERLDVTISVGGAAFPAHGSSAATLMRAADKALYVAKNEGRDRFHMAEA